MKKELSILKKYIALFFVTSTLLTACGGGSSDTPPIPPIEILPACPAASSGVATIAPSYHGTTTVAICSNIFIDPSFSRHQQALIIASVNAAIEINKAFYGSLQTDIPDIIACNTDVCANYFAGTTTGNNTTYPNGHAGEYVPQRTTVAMTAPYWGGVNTQILAHELSHVELYKRTGGVPVIAWFNEGLATYIGKQNQCAGLAKGIDDLTKLNLQEDWNTYTGVGGMVATTTYCQASAEVEAWITQKGGNAAILQLLEGLRQGQSFYTLYGVLLT